ncbi:tetratricopeptide repeat protein 16 [Dasypus novemcinctus]|uniref:tetratricopeptide repeat protein 16 n=1 Tax=Dasypus novemcinctus TaxID=9361 RepID=UPI00265EE13C|nr:tetratricopeptide repeat protein 16 [Dasypus novemcinctus]
MTDSSEDPLKQDQACSQHISKPRVIPVPKGTLQRIFGTSQVFQGFEEPQQKPKELTVPLKVREYYFQGQKSLERQDWEMAVLFFSRALHLDPNLVDFYALRAEAYIQLCDFSSAAQNLRRAHSFQPENTKYLERLTLVLYLQGQCLLEQCAYVDALHVFSQASKLQPKKSCFQYRCMACLLALERYHDCLLLIAKELKQGTSNADIYILQARLHNFLEKPSLCYRDLHSALLLEPKHPQARVLLKTMVNQAQKVRQDAGVLAVQGHLQQALQCINCAIENNPLDPSLFLFRGTMYRRLREFAGAMEDLLKALDMAPESQEDMVLQAQRQLLLAYNDFAVHCYMQGAYQESVLLLNKALKDEQQEKGLYINRGDCFFQLGNLAFAEADYQQALALSPRDQGANFRMGLLQEKMGLCEQRRRQFQKAENHFSVAIQHDPQKAQYYLHRAKSRQMLQNFFGARQDVATVLLLDPKQSKLLPLMSNLFPGMSVEDVLDSQVAHLAKLQLERVVESIRQSSIPQGMLRLLREQELHRQKEHTWKLEKPWFETTEELEATPHALQPVQERPEEEAEAPEEEKGQEQKPEPIPAKVTSLSDSYVDQASSGSTLDFRVTSISETESSTICQEYRSTSASAVTLSTSSLLKTLSSDSEINGPSQGQIRTKTEAAGDQSQGSSKTKAAQGPRQRLRAKSTRSQRQGPRKATYTQGWSSGLNRSSSKTKVFCDLRQSSSKAETAQGLGQRPGKTETPQDQSQRPSKAKAVQSRNNRPSKDEATQGRSRRLSRSLSKAKVFCDSGQSSSKAETAQGLGQRPSKPETALGLGQRPSKPETAQGLGQRPSKPETAQGLDQRPSKPETAQGLDQRPSKPETAPDQSQESRKAKVDQSRNHKPSKDEASQGQSRRQSRSFSKVKVSYDASQSSSKMEATQGPSHRPSKAKFSLDQSQRSSVAEAALGRSQRPSKSDNAQGWSWEQSQSSSKTKATQVSTWRPSKTEAFCDPSQRSNKIKDTESPSQSQSQGQSQSQRPNKIEATWGLRQNSRRTESTRNLSLSPSKPEADQSWSQSTSQSPGKTEAMHGHRPSRSDAL